MNETIKTVIIDPILNILYFPLWWYSKGIKKTFVFLTSKIQNLSKSLGIKTLFAYLFKPMFGQYDFKGRIISFFMRSFILGWRLFLFFLGIIFLFILLIIWLALPVFAIWQITKLI